VTDAREGPTYRGDDGSEDVARVSQIAQASPATTSVLMAATMAFQPPVVQIGAPSVPMALEPR
jgi:hypothetical protein